MLATPNLQHLGGFACWRRLVVRMLIVVLLGACATTTDGGQDSSDQGGPHGPTDAPAGEAVAEPSIVSTGSVVTTGPAVSTSPVSTATTKVSTTPAPSGPATASPDSAVGTSTGPPDPPPSTETAPTASVADASCGAGLSVRQQAALVVWPSVYSTDWDLARSVVAEEGLGGVLLMRPDGWRIEDVRQRLAELESLSPYGLIVATDEEGGDVQRLALIEELPSQRSVSLESDPQLASELITRHGELIRDAGVDMVLGPVVDVEPNVGEVPLQPSRFFVGTPDVVSRYARSYIEGWDRAGLYSVLKHYPGHGAASGDTHITEGVTPSFDDISTWDLQPYRELAGTARSLGTSVMVGHLTVPGLTDGVPATRSRGAVEYLRDDLGYGDTLLITDALGMAAVGLAEPEASVLAIEAGIDIVIFTQTSQTRTVIDAIVAAVDSGRIAADQLAASAAKVLDMHTRDIPGCPTE